MLISDATVNNLVANWPVLMTSTAAAVVSVLSWRQGKSNGLKADSIVTKTDDIHALASEHTQALKEATATIVGLQDLAEVHTSQIAMISAKQEQVKGLEVTSAIK